MSQSNPSTSQVFSSSPSKGVLAELMTFLFGETSKATTSMLATVNQRQATARVEPGVVSPAAVDTAAPTVEVDAPLQGTLAGTFKEALTGATASFIRRYVTPIHEEKNTWGFLLRRVVVMYPDAAVFFLKDFTTMAAEIRDEISKIRIQKASGSEQLCLDSYYGISFENSSGDAVFEGRLVEQLVMWRGASVNIKFVFDGEYAVLPQRTPIPVPAVHEGGPGSESTLLDEVLPAAQFAVSAARCSNRHQHHATTAIRESEEAPQTASDATEASVGGGTPMRTARTFQKAPYLRVSLMAGDATHTVDVYEENFPITVGRHHTFEGFSLSCANDEQPPVSLFAKAFPSTAKDVFTSRSHLVINRTERQNTVLIDNSEGSSKNGTFCVGKAQREHFIYHTGTGEWLCLGAPKAGNVLQLKITRI